MLTNSTVAPPRVVSGESSPSPHEAGAGREDMMAADASSDLTVAPLAGPDIQRIGQIAVPVKDLDRAVTFYRDVLGLRLLFQAPPGLAFFECGGVRLMLSLPEAPDQDHPGSVIYYVVDDLAAAWKAVTARGATPGAAGAAEPHLIAKMPDHDLWMAFVDDGEGNLVGLMSEVRPPAP
jgi:catechol 2,3-dioxygenase-like lactoylglutathione lyase family enzyme